MCPESRRSIQIRESAAVENPVCARLVVTVFGLIFIIYFPRRDNVSLLRAFKAISEFVVDRLLAQFINLFLSVTGSAPFHRLREIFFQPFHGCLEARLADRLFVTCFQTK